MIRVRHYTRVSSMRKILAEGVIRARDRNMVFVERANARKLSPSDAQAKYGLRPGKANAFIEFDVETELLLCEFNDLSQAYEYSIVGNVDLADRNPEAFFNF